MRILLLSNSPTPYQLDFWETVAEKAEMRAVFLWSRSANLDWEANYPSWLRILNYKDAKSGWNALGAILDEFKPDVVIVGAGFGGMPLNT